MIECHQLSAEATSHLWPDLRVHVELALARDPYESIVSEEVEQQLKSGFAQLLVAVDDGRILGTSVVQMFKRGQLRILHILIVAGVEMERWTEPMLAEYEALAEVQDIDAITLSGRPGWTRKLTPYGYRTDHVEMIKILRNKETENVGRQVEIAGEIGPS